MWRNLTCRYSKRTQELVLLLCVQLAGVNPSVWEQELARLTALLTALRRGARVDDENAMKQMIAGLEVSADAAACAAGMCVSFILNEYIRYYGYIYKNVYCAHDANSLPWCVLRRR